MKWLEPWITLAKWLNSYRRSYGGFRGVLKSPFFGLAFVITSLSYSMWLDPIWVGKVESLVPSLLGFSLGTYAIIFSILGGRVKGAMRQVKAPHGVSYLEAVNAVFFHFIFIQVASLLWAFLYQGRLLVDLFEVVEPRIAEAQELFTGMRLAGSFVGCFLLVYSILLMIAAAMAVYRLALLKDPTEVVPDDGGGVGEAKQAEER